DLSRREMLRGTGLAGIAGAVSLAAIDRASAAEAPKDARRFEGRVAIVTGGARGQGRAHAVRLARAGATGVLCDLLKQIATITYPRATQADMDETVKLVEAAGGRCLAIKADVRDSKAVNDVVARTVKQFGKVDVLLANAGILGATPLVKTSDQAFEDMV